MTPDPKKETHAERRQSLLNGGGLLDALAYADELHAALEVERSRNGFLEASERLDLETMIQNEHALYADAMKQLEIEREARGRAEQILETVRIMAKEGAELPYYDPETKADAGDAWRGRLKSIVEFIDSTRKGAGAGGPS